MQAGCSGRPTCLLFAPGVAKSIPFPGARGRRSSTAARSTGVAGVRKRGSKRALFGRFCVVLYEFRALFVRFFAALPVHRDGMERAARRRRAARWRHDQRQALPLHVFNFDTSFLGMQCAGVHRTRRAAARRASAACIGATRKPPPLPGGRYGSTPPISGADFSFFVRRGRAFARHAPRARERVVSLPDAAAITRHSFLARR